MPSRHRCRRGSAAFRDDRGMATAELAVVLPALVLVAALAVWTLTAAAAQLRCVDAARAAARELARGEPVEVVRELGTRRAPDGARVMVTAQGDGLVSVEVRLRVAFPLSDGLGLDVGGRAVASVEPAAVSGSAFPP